MTILYSPFRLEFEAVPGGTVHLVFKTIETGEETPVDLIVDAQGTASTNVFPYQHTLVCVRASQSYNTPDGLHVPTGPTQQHRWCGVIYSTP